MTTTITTESTIPTTQVIAMIIIIRTTIHRLIIMKQVIGIGIEKKIPIIMITQIASAHTIGVIQRLQGTVTSIQTTGTMALLTMLAGRPMRGLET